MPLAGVGTGLDIKSGEGAEEEAIGNEKHAFIDAHSMSPVLDSREAKVSKMLPSLLNLPH